MYYINSFFSGFLLSASTLDQGLQPSPRLSRASDSESVPETDNAPSDPLCSSSPFPLDDPVQRDASTRSDRCTRSRRLVVFFYLLVLLVFVRVEPGLSIALGRRERYVPSLSYVPFFTSRIPARGLRRCMALEADTVCRCRANSRIRSPANASSNRDARYARSTPDRLQETLQGRTRELGYRRLQVGLRRSRGQGARDVQIEIQ